MTWNDVIGLFSRTQKLRINDVDKWYVVLLFIPLFWLFTLCLLQKSKFLIAEDFRIWYKTNLEFLTYVWRRPSTWEMVKENRLNGQLYLNNSRKFLGMWKKIKWKKETSTLFYNFLTSPYRPNNLLQFYRFIYDRVWCPPTQPVTQSLISVSVSDLISLNCKI